MKLDQTKRKATMLMTLVAAGALLVAGCAVDADPEQGNGLDNSNADIYTIGVIQSIEHSSLDSAYEGFKAALTDNGYVEGTDVVYDYQNAQGEQNNLSTIGDRFVSRQMDMVLAITTDAAQTMAGKTTEIPILGTAITSYTIANLIDSDEIPGGNISGTSDMNPVAAQIDLLVELVPEVETIGLIYNSGEDNSVLQIKIAKEEIETRGLQWTEVTVVNTGDVMQAMQQLVSKCEAIYIPTDNTLASSMATVHSVAGEAKIPTICGATSMAEDGGLASIGIDYYQLGYETGLMAIEVMNGADISAMPIRYLDKNDLVIINGQVAEEIGFTVPEQYLDAVINVE